MGQGRREMPEIDLPKRPRRPQAQQNAILAYRRAVG